ncbi:phage tail sheath C-terminal domain-containing protein [Tenacibaculum sp. FZY0031]|uniref:phage tail sheath family protein n=1 Tax=Tenacibaculum sp. FZY0031 TaxID=3116648 RepID=UPI002EBB6B78|nr:phage tail sheath C-terminal domain-containing protein [Tenacibaculum sp. FZY0031]
MSAYKTPGVYVEEIVKFPPSVAQVETAIPAFIGYTEKATKKAIGDLKGVPTRISSMLEYENYYGKPKNETGIKVSVVNGEIYAEGPSKNERSPFFMYYAMQMFFANGGGPCYIVSVGRYGTDIDDADSQETIVEQANLKTGLDTIEKVDEVTLIVFPDASNLGDVDSFYGLYNDALKQCLKLKDRFVIIDTEHDDDTQSPTPVEDLRNKISNIKDEVKYGGAYYPYVNTILDYMYDESKISVIEKSTTQEDLEAAVQEISDSIDTAKFTDLRNSIDALKADADANVTDATSATAFVPIVKAAIDNIINYINTLKVDVETALVISQKNTAVATESNALDAWITNVLEGAILDFNKSKDNLNSDDTAIKIKNEIDIDTAAIDALKTSVDTCIASGELDAVITALNTNATVLPTTTTVLKSLKTTNNRLYNQVKAEIGRIPLTLPPSSSIAGIYAAVDENRGVWKAPANVSLNYVIEPTIQVSHDEQQGLNVDEVAGKSINVIRAFKGKGNLVWGARTLAGNDNEWRYVSVRRFFNMAEESIKKATEQFVFEPNDKNTWVRVKAMIDNFLTQQWRAGALAGPTPEKAFYVSVGLGETMTAQDVLEGNMIIEIGMAVVRPAEFIILKFSHKMQEA